MILQGNQTKNIKEPHESKREHILNVAEDLFIRNGIDHVTLSDISRAARITRAALHEYFPNKQEIAWAIILKILWSDQADIVAQIENSGDTGLKRLEDLMLRFVNKLVTRPEHERYIVEFHSIYARESSPDRMRESIEQSWPDGYNLFAQMVRQGINDGSISPDMNPELLSAAILNLVTGMNSRFALLGDHIKGEYGQPALVIYREICRVFLRGIRACPTDDEGSQKIRHMAQV